MSGQGDHVFRLSTYARNAGVATVTIFVGAIALILCVPSVNGDVLGHVIACAVFGFFAVLGLWILAAYWKESLSIGDGVVLHKAIFRTKRLKLADIVEIRWQTPTRVVLRSATDRLTIWINTFGLEDRREMIRQLRDSVPYSLQRDWDRFCYQVALPLSPRPGGRLITEDDVREALSRLRRSLLRIVALTAAVGIGLVLYLQDARWLLLPAPFLMLWLASLLILSRMVVRRPVEPDKRSVWAVVLCFGVGFGGSHLLLSRQQPLAASLWMMVWMCVLLVLGRRLERGRWNRLRSDTERAVEQWESQEAADRA